MHAGGNTQHEIEAASIGELLQTLVEKYPPLSRHLRRQDGTLFPHINLYVNSVDVRDPARREGDRLADGDMVTLIPSIAGG